ncbi:MAG: hypothetical protein A3J27_06840 [Candidatus Tectomicrobia bacterium RIFCSPLOWO2_12_FULL_69_37]|nr:MAG: hypothetical protein A3I72_05010 [Candidatus Tectomicrobia bacterium RIFCSPLOWO2_02_FULL_70_19]OGL69623.1 MAG: hypothetical protein A3J27_06840 [Candidatus Tectomicrobia bacterium RIFCSPLOWO2_12_FULL_69_37]
MRGALSRLCLLLAPVLLASCAGHEAIPWREAPGRAGAVRAMGERLAAGLAEGVKVAGVNVGRFRAVDPRAPAEAAVLRVVVAGFPEARTGARTPFSRQVEEAVRRALARSARFRVVDGGEGVAWQEARMPRVSSPRPDDEEEGIGFFENAPVGEWRAEAFERKQRGQEASPEVFSEELDGDHPLRGLWPRARGGPYGEESAVYAASIFEADAAVFGAYALGPGRVRVWAAVVLNTAPRIIYYARGLKDVFGLPERVEAGRIYLAHARDALPRGAVPDEALTAWVPPRPRLAPVHPPFWGEPALEVVLEEIDRGGQRKRLAAGNLVGADSLVVGRMAARGVRHVYAFALNREGEAEEVLFSSDPQRPGWAQRVAPGRFVPFAVRMVEPQRMYRLFFVSSPEPFEGGQAVRSARERLGLGPGGPSGPARSAGDAARGAPPRPWFVAGGQDRLILRVGWDQQVFWLFRQGPR